MTRARVVLGVAVAAAVGAAVATAFWRSAAAPPALPEIGGFVLPEPRALDGLELVDSQAQPFHARDFAGHWSFLYFGYTYCPDACPLAMVELASLKELLTAQAPDTRVEYYLVSVDPQRDTAERLREYVAYFDPAFRGLTGEPEQIAALARAAGAVYFVPPGQDEKTYLVSHSSSITLLDPDGRLHAVFTSPHEPGQLARDFGKIVARYRTLGGSREPRDR